MLPGRVSSCMIKLALKWLWRAKHCYGNSTGGSRTSPFQLGPLATLQKALKRWRFLNDNEARAAVEN
ncbi:hypothetical protein TNCV_4625311 [Trichonephila clavipes]|nr:hypothetical protein TNCV_4625311 [Trichonephila clavipes]